MPTYNKIKENSDPIPKPRVNPQQVFQRPDSFADRHEKKKIRVHTHSPIRGAGSSRRIFAFEKTDIEGIKKLTTVRNLTPQTNRITFNPRDPPKNEPQEILFGKP